MDIEKDLPAIETATQRTCRACLEKNLIEEVFLARCATCSLIFCTHFASNIDPQFCTECFSDITLHKEVITKTYQYENADGEVAEYKRKARLIRLEGLSWLFIQRKILDMSDEALELAIEYHREIMTGMVSEREQRKNKFMHRYAGVNYTIPPVDTATSTSTTVKKSRTISSTRATATASGMLQSYACARVDY